LVPIIDSLLQRHLKQWASEGEIKDFYHKLEGYAFDVAASILWAEKEFASPFTLKAFHLFEGIHKGTLFKVTNIAITSRFFIVVSSDVLLGIGALPVKLPGTNYHYGLKCREELVKHLKQKYDAAVQNPNREKENGLFGLYISHLISTGELESREIKTLDFFVGLLFAGKHLQKFR
jgi:hypothetical protein